MKLVHNNAQATPAWALFIGRTCYIIIPGVDALGCVVRYVIRPTDEVVAATHEMRVYRRCAVCYDSTNAGK